MCKLGFSYGLPTKKVFFVVDLSPKAKSMDTESEVDEGPKVVKYGFPMVLLDGPHCQYAIYMFKAERRCLGLMLGLQATHHA